MLDGYQRYDVSFCLASVDEVTFKLVKFRPFNDVGTLNQLGESPDCIGQFEFSTNVYEYIVAVTTTSSDGNLKYTYCDLILDPADIDCLLYKLRNILSIEENYLEFNVAIYHQLRLIIDIMLLKFIWCYLNFMRKIVHL